MKAQKQEWFLSAKERIAQVFVHDRKLIYKVVLVILILGTALGFRIKEGTGETVKLEKRGKAVAAGKEASGSTVVYVDISGAVVSPGVYEVTDKTRLFELIKKAGGLSDNADVDAINQAEVVQDGQKIYIPVRGGDGQEPERGEERSAATSTRHGISLNSASKDELMRIPGVGEVIAERILEYRASKRFKDVKELKEIKGIGDATFEKMKGMVTL